MFESGNSNHGALHVTNKLQKSYLRRQQTTGTTQRKGDTVLTNGQSAGGGTWKNTESNQMGILKTVFKRLTVLQNCKFKLLLLTNKQIMQK